MPRRARAAHGGLVYHVLNRTVAGLPLSRKQPDDHLLAACRYVERNALTAGAVERAEDWCWGSLWARRRGSEPLKELLSDWPLERPRNWVALVNEPMTGKEVERFQTCIARNRPYGEEPWQNDQAR